jgi:hypothetical protein
MPYKKVGGLHFFSLGRFGLTFYIKRNRWDTHASIERAAKRKANLARLRAAASMGDYDAKFGYRLSEPDWNSPEYDFEVTSGGNK